MADFTYLKKKTADGNIVVVYPFTYQDPYFTPPPIGAEYVQAGIVETGREAVLLDMRFESDIREQLENADIVCIYGYFEDCSMFGKWKYNAINVIMEQIPDDTPVIAGGTGFSDPDEAFLKYPKIDVVLRGNPETPVMQLLSGEEVNTICNLAYRDGDEIVYTERVIHVLPDDIYPRRSLRNPKYKYHAGGIKLDMIRAGAGCDYRCKFCYQYGKDLDSLHRRWQGRSAKSLFSEIQEIEAPVIGWVDDDMTASMETLDSLADMLIENKTHKLYAGTGRLDHVIKSNLETLRKLEKSGLLALSFGVESLKEETLRFYGKGQQLEDIEKAMRMMQQTNILLFCNFIFGSPGETREDMLAMLDFGRKWNVDTLVTNRLSVPEGSRLHEAIYDPETKRPRPGLDMIDHKELRKIKYTVKFAQRTPLRLLLSALKLYRHKGMKLEPLYILFSAAETAVNHTWLRYTVIIPLILKTLKLIAKFPGFRFVTRALAYILTPFVIVLNQVSEFFDRYLKFSTVLIPKFFLFLKYGIYEKQKDRMRYKPSING